MTLMYEPVRRWVGAASADTEAIERETGRIANPEAFTDTRWVTIRGDIAPRLF